MAATRYNYTTVRTEKKNQESTFPLRYILGTPGPGQDALLPQDAHVVWQKWGGNIAIPQGGHPIDIDTALKGLGRVITRDCLGPVPVSGVPQGANTGTLGISESRTTHPSWQVMETQTNRMHPLVVDFQGSAISPTHLPQNTSLALSDAYAKHNAV